jgi:hypothetical protein
VKSADEELKNHRFIFVCGLHRSGTSILFKSLRDHPLVSGLEGTGVPEDEGQHVQSVFLPAHAYGGASKFGFHPGAHLTETSALVTPANRDKLFSEWSRYWDLRKQYLLEKSPPNLIRTRFLQAIFPESYFVVIVRHPIAYAFPRGEANKSRMIYGLLRHWIACHQIFWHDRPYLRNQIVLRYEDFVAQPERWLRAIHDFVGLRFHPTEREVRPDINKKYFDQWNSWGNTLTGRLWKGIVVRKFEEPVASFGYRLKAPDELMPSVSGS